jgi:hypothetical protein
MVEPTRLTHIGPSKSCTTGKERRITRWEHEHVLQAVQCWLDEQPEKIPSGARRAADPD